MTPRERIVRTMNHQRPDRVPTFLGARPEVNRALMEHFGTDSLGEVKRLLGADGWAYAGPTVDDSDFLARTNGVLESDAPGGGARYIFHGPDVFEDAWGVVKRLGRDRKYLEWVSGPLADADDPDEYGRFDPARVKCAPDLPARVKRLQAEGNFVISGVTVPFKLAWNLRGMENLLCDYAANPGFVEKLYDNIARFHRPFLEGAARAGVDMICIGGDVAMQDRIIVGAERWRRIDKPPLAELVAAAKAIKPDLHVFTHSDGNLTDIMDDLIEIGFDVIDPIQPECMDPAAVKRKWGDRITLHGCGSLQRTLPFGSVEDVQNEVRGLIRNCGRNGGLVLRPSNAIGFDCPLENVLAFYQTAMETPPPE